MQSYHVGDAVSAHVGDEGTKVLAKALDHGSYYDVALGVVGGARHATKEWRLHAPDMRQYVHERRAYTHTQRLQAK